MTALPASSAAERARRAGTLVTPALGLRPHRPPDFAAESESMHRLAQAHSPPRIAPCCKRSQTWH